MLTESTGGKMKILGDICLTIGWLIVNFIALALDGIYWILDKACWILELIGKGASYLYNAYPKLTIAAITCFTGLWLTYSIASIVGSYQ